MMLIGEEDVVADKIRQCSTTHVSRPGQAVEVECGYILCKYVRNDGALMAVKKLYICRYSARDTTSQTEPYSRSATLRSFVVYPEVFIYSKKRR
jgi:hypothetical protein